MFGVLLESTPRRQRRSGGAVLSVMVHVGILTLVAALTARGSSVTQPPAPVVVTRFRLAPMAPAHSQHTRRSSHTAAPCCPVTEIAVPLVLPRMPRLGGPTQVELPPLHEAEDLWPGAGEHGARSAFGGGILDGDDSTTEWNA